MSARKKRSTYHAQPHVHVVLDCSRSSIPVLFKDVLQGRSAGEATRPDPPGSDALPTRQKRAPRRALLEPQRERGVNCHVTLASHQSAWLVSCIPRISEHSGKKLSPLFLLGSLYAPRLGKTPEQPDCAGCHPSPTSRAYRLRNFNLFVPNHIKSSNFGEKKKKLLSDLKKLLRVAVQTLCLVKSCA